MATNDPLKVITPEFRVSFPHVFKPQPPMQQGADPKFGLTMLFPKDADLTALKKAARTAIEEKWGTDQEKWPKNLRLPFRDQSEKEFDGYEPGAIFVNCTSKMKPGLVDASLNEISDMDQNEFYPGCYAKASIRAFTYDVNGNRGVGFGLNNIQKTRDGEPLGGRTRPEDDFSPVEGDPMSEDQGTPAPANNSVNMLD